MSNDMNGQILNIIHLEIYISQTIAATEVAYPSTYFTAFGYFTIISANLTIKRLLRFQHLSLELTRNDGTKCFWPCPWLKKYGILKHSQNRPLKPFMLAGNCPGLHLENESPLAQVTR